MIDRCLCFWSALTGARWLPGLLGQQLVLGLQRGRRHGSDGCECVHGQPTVSLSGMASPCKLQLTLLQLTLQAFPALY